MQKLQSMYAERRELGFGIGTKHMNLIADPSTHSKKETMVSVAYAWERDLGAICDVQCMPQGKAVLESEANLPERIANLASEGRLERVAAFRQMQAVSSTIHHLTGARRLGIDFFALPGSVLVRPVGEQEKRVLKVEEGKTKAYFEDRTTGEEVETLPLLFLTFPLLILGLDQGSIGAAGVAFADSLGF
jgi:hypothetical protein